MSEKVCPLCMKGKHEKFMGDESKECSCPCHGNTVETFKIPGGFFKYAPCPNGGCEGCEHRGRHIVYHPSMLSTGVTL